MASPFLLRDHCGIIAGATRNDPAIPRGENLSLPVEVEIGTGTGFFVHPRPHGSSAPFGFIGMAHRRIFALSSMSSIGIFCQRQNSIEN